MLVPKSACGVTFGRFALPHFGHVELIEQILSHAERADVHLSGHEKNNDWDIRVLLLKHLCRLKEVDLTRVNFYNSPTVGEAMAFSLDTADGDTVLVLGSDQVKMGEAISKAFSTKFLINRRSTSSTEIRHFLDTFDFIEDLKEAIYNGNEFSITLAKVLRKEEIYREKFGTIT
jgi:hypothetical protein